MRLAAVLFLPGLLLLPVSLVHGVPLEAGAARIEITPPVGHPMWGYGARHDQPSTGVRDPLYARALVLAAGEARIAIVSLDLGRAPHRAGMEAIRQRTRDQAKVEHLFVVASHTHNGPVIELDTWPKGDKPYTRQLEDRIVQVITEAAGKLQPARLGFRTIEVGLNRNRHSKRKENPPRDKDLIVVRLESVKGQPLAHLVNFAAHPTMIDAKSHEISADFPGVLARVVEKEAGGVCLFLQGAAGDMSTNPTPGNGGPDRFGEELGRLVLAQNEKIRCTTAEVSSLKAREHDFTFGKRVDLGNPLIRAAYSRAFFPELVDFYEREYRKGIRPHLLQEFVFAQRATAVLYEHQQSLVGLWSQGNIPCTLHQLFLRRIQPEWTELV